MERFAVITTITVTDEEQLRRAIKAVRNLHAGARLEMRRAYGQQSAAFSAGLGLRGESVAVLLFKEGCDGQGIR